jgi:hypothetical protein
MLNFPASERAQYCSCPGEQNRLVWGTQVIIWATHLLNVVLHDDAPDEETQIAGADKSLERTARRGGYSRE